MPTEEEKEERLRLYEKYAQNSLFGIFGGLFDQTSIYRWMLEASMRFSNVPYTIITIPRRTSSRSVMNKVMEFNRCMDLKSEDYNEEDWKDENIVAQFKIDELHENKTIEITLEELKKELKDHEELIEILNGDFHVGIDTDSIWYSEAMQNPCPTMEEVHSPNEMSDITEAGDGPLEVGRQIHEAIARTMRLSRRDNETDEEFRNRINQSIHPPGRIRITPNQWAHRGCSASIFLAHQRRDICSSCARTCTEEVCERSRKDNACPAYIPKNRREVIEQECCAVCNMTLDEPENFPKSFPDKWKVCCYCSEVWARFNSFRGEEFIHTGFNWIELKERWEKFGKKFKEVFEL